jgi:hypothetical protein
MVFLINTSTVIPKSITNIPMSMMGRCTSMSIPMNLILTNMSTITTPARKRNMLMSIMSIIMTIKDSFSGN